MQFEMFYSLNKSVGAWFAHLHQVGFKPTFPNLGMRLWLYQCECEAICPSTTWEGDQTPHICMTWTWDTVWKVLQPQSMRSSMVCIPASCRISANSSKSGEASVVVSKWVWSHMPIHNLRRCSNTSYICMTWTWDAVWKVLQPQQKRSGIVCTLASCRISAYFPKSGEASVVVTVWVWGHMPIHNLRRCSNLSYMYAMDMGCSLKGSTASSKA